MSGKEIKFERGLERPAVRSRVMRRRARSGRGFTLLELAMVMAVILILVSITFPAYQTAIRRSREAVLRDDLTTMRQVIDELQMPRFATELKHRAPYNELFATGKPPHFNDIGRENVRRAVAELNALVVEIDALIDVGIAGEGRGAVAAAGGAS